MSNPNTQDHNKKDDDHGPPQWTVTIVVNGRKREINGKEISFEEVIKLAYDNPPFGANTIFTVTYARGQGNKPEGTLVAGDSVKVKEGMVFNVTATDKS